MRPIEEKYLQQLRERGLLTDGPFPPSHILAHTFKVLKPATTKGNSVPGYNMGFRKSSETISCDAPIVWIRQESDKWAVWMQEGCPEMIPGDFKNYWDTEQEAIDDVLDLFFGDPKRLNAVQ